MYDDIVVPTDGSEGAERAVEHAVEIARGRDATVHFVHVIDERNFIEDLNWSPIRDELRAEAGSITGRAVEIAEELDDEERDVDIVTMEEVKDGVPHEEILDYSDEVDADMIVMGTHGRTGVEKVVLGSVTEKVVRGSDVPVLAAPFND